MLPDSSRKQMEIRNIHDVVVDISYFHLPDFIEAASFLKKTRRLFGNLNILH